MKGETTALEYAARSGYCSNEYDLLFYLFLYIISFFEGIRGVGGWGFTANSKDSSQSYVMILQSIFTIDTVTIVQFSKKKIEWFVATPFRKWSLCWSSLELWSSLFLRNSDNNQRKFPRIWWRKANKYQSCKTFEKYFVQFDRVRR